ncbi:hypothetical protein [Prescottella equi]
MTTTAPHEPGTGRPKVFLHGPIPHRSRLPAAAMILGALSLVSFWLFGLGLPLGLGAVVSGLLATSRAATADDEAASLRALLGIVAGTAGITAATIAALIPLQSHLKV